MNHLKDNSQLSEFEIIDLSALNTEKFGRSRNVILNGYMTLKIKELTTNNQYKVKIYESRLPDSLIKDIETKLIGKNLINQLDEKSYPMFTWLESSRELIKDRISKSTNNKINIKINEISKYVTFDDDFYQKDKNLLNYYRRKDYYNRAIILLLIVIIRSIIIWLYIKFKT